jgi:ParB-like chromosome segregation protein Spo0J
MDMKPILLPLQEIETRKARELRKRGYPDALIADTMGITRAHLANLLPPAKAPAEPHGKDKKKTAPGSHAGKSPESAPSA